MKYLSNYEFEHTFFVMMIDIISKKQEHYFQMLGRKEYIRKLLDAYNHVTSFVWEEFFVENDYLYPEFNQHAIIYTFPFPRIPDDALFGAVVYWDHDNSAEYYTLVRSEKKGSWVLYRNDINTCVVVGMLSGDPSKEKFLKMIRNAKGKPSLEDKLLSLIPKA